MIDLQNRIIDDYGIVALKEDYIFSLMYSGEKDLSNILATNTPGVKRYNELCLEVDDSDKCLTVYEAPVLPLQEYDRELQDQWFIPAEYSDINVRELLLQRCQNDVERARIEEEWELFQEHQMVPVLQLLIYLVDVMRKNKIVWGVGRGSSVASYALYLIGIHKVDSIKFDLDIREFLK